MQEYDIVVVGAGPAGLMLSVHLARWGYKIKHIDNRPEPTATGRADGIQPRSLDLIKNLGLKRQFMAHNPARVFEVAFWDPLDNEQGIHRTGTSPSCPDFIDTRHRFTTLLHQGFIENIFIADIKKNGVQIDRPWTITGFRNTTDTVYPLEVDIEHVKLKAKETVKAKYLFSGEGGKSFTRDQLGIRMQYKDPIAHVWGVMDGVVRTDFPDIKMKCTIHSDSGSIMIIPRENNLVRLYIQLASSSDADWNPKRQASAEEVQQRAKKILQPYWIEWDWIEWYSVYPIGQGLAERYTLDERVFLGGDVCHTHSPKAGQGMNTAFLDAQNLAWKIHHVEAGFAMRSILKTYESERRQVAENLLNFDQKYAKLFSERQPSAGEVKDPDHTPESNKFVELFKANSEFTSGYGVAYGENDLNWTTSHPAQNSLFDPKGSELRVGRTLPPSSVIRVVDANEVHLEEEIPVNGAYRIYLFAGDPKVTGNAVKDFAANLNKRHSFYKNYELEDLAQVSYHEQHNPHSRFFTICTIFDAERADIELSSLPAVLSRFSNHIYVDRVRRSNTSGFAHAKLGIKSKENGAVVVVRPDGYVACVTALVEGSATVDALNTFFSVFTTRKAGSSMEARL